ncbi:MAG: hypothetical protein HKM92_13070 [Arenibacter sp.]|nr:hypothetical protein [Arenibacter sp.]
MKKINAFFKLGLAMFALFYGITAVANTSLNIGKYTPVKAYESYGEEDFIGNWKYSAENVPYEYANGILFITKEKGDLKVLVALAGGERKAKNVKVDGKTLTFTLDIEGDLVSVTLKVDGDKISGEASSYDGVFALQGERRLDPE